MYARRLLLTAMLLPVFTLTAHPPLLRAEGCDAPVACRGVEPTARAEFLRPLASVPDVGIAAKPKQSPVAYVSGRAGATDLAGMTQMLKL